MEREFLILWKRQILSKRLKVSWKFKSKLYLCLSSLHSLTKVHKMWIIKKSFKDKNLVIEELEQIDRLVFRQAKPSLVAIPICPQNVVFCWRKIHKFELLSWINLLPHVYGICSSQMSWLAGAWGGGGGGGAGGGGGNQRHWGRSKVEWSSSRGRGQVISTPCNLQVGQTNKYMTNKQMQQWCN